MAIRLPCQVETHRMVPSPTARKFTATTPADPGFCPCFGGHFTRSLRLLGLLCGLGAILSGTVSAGCGRNLGSDSESESQFTRCEVDADCSVGSCERTYCEKDGQRVTASSVARTSAHETGFDAGDVPSRDAGGDASDYVEPGCRELGFEYSEDCQACPSRSVECPCNGFNEYFRATGVEGLPTDATTLFELGCSYGSCLVAVDCDVYCAAIHRAPELYMSAERCPWARTCATNADCGDDRCWGESGETRGSCFPGQDENPCFDASDCVGGYCGPHGCTSGRVGAVCGSAEHCATGECVGHIQERGYGVCSSGEHGHACISQLDCASGLYCLADHETCFDGRDGSSCEVNEQCSSGGCSAGTCTAGNLDDWCDDDADCQSNHCRVQEIDSEVLVGRCIAGTAGEVCFFDGDCEGGHCVTLIHNVEGTCTAGAPGEPCYDDDDCESRSCIERERIVSSSYCPVGGPCRGSGICVDDATCALHTCD